MRTIILLVAIAGCTSKGSSLAQLQKDGYGCTKAGAAAAFVPKAGEHCFMCPDDASLSKCSQNPLESGCKEVDAASCGK